MTQKDYNIILDKTKNLIAEKGFSELENFLGNLHPADMADALEQLASDERLSLFKALAPERAGEVLIEISSPLRETLVNEFDEKTIADIINELESDDAADIVNYLDRDKANKIINTVLPDVSEELKKLLFYKTDTAGGKMALEFVAMNAGSTIAEAIEHIREKREEVENLYFVWVVDDFGQLVGVVSMKDLVLEPQDKTIKEIMNPNVISVDTEMDQEEVARIAKQYDLVHIPVVNRQHKLIGRITNDDIIDVIEEEASEDISLMGGVLAQEIAEESAVKISKARLPWLLLGLLGGLMSAIVINHFHCSIEKMLALSFFIPVVMAMGGNSGTQAATVVIRGLATGDISVVNTGKRLLVELLVALINGILCGTLLGIIITFWLSDLLLGLGIGISLITVIIFSGSFGAFVPFFLNKFDVDPALAAGPFITTTNDIFGLMIYLNIITYFL